MLSDYSSETTLKAALQALGKKKKKRIKREKERKKQSLRWDLQMDGGHGPSWWARRCRSPPDPLGLSEAFPGSLQEAGGVREPLLAQELSG